MDDTLNLLDNIQKKEIITNKFSALNKIIKPSLDCILNVNIRSLNANFTSLQIFIENLEFKPAIVICSETWNLDYYKYFTLSGYKIFYNDSHINSADGTVMYIMTEIDESTEIISFGKLKIIHATIKLNSNNCIEISALYRSHDLPKPEFIFELKKFIKSKSKAKNHLILGDFNINILSQGFYSEEFLMNFLENGYIPAFQTITRPSANGTDEGSCIDNIFIKSEHFNTTAVKYANLFNDHYPLFLTLEKFAIELPGTNNHINYSNLIKAAKTIIWSEILYMQDPNKMTDKLIQSLNVCIELSKIKGTSKQKSRDNEPRKKWMTSGIIRSCLHKEQLYLAWKRNVQNNVLKAEYYNYVKI